MQAIRKIVYRKSIKSIHVPEEFGEKVEILVFPLTDKQGLTHESKELMILQEQTGFAQTVLADDQEDVWNDI